MIRAATEFMSVEILLFLASVAIASLVVCGAAILLLRCFRTASLPMKHSVCVCALIAVLASPLLLAWSPVRALSPFTVAMENRNRAALEVHESAGDVSSPHLRRELGDRVDAMTLKTVETRSPAVTKNATSNVAVESEPQLPASAATANASSPEAYRAAGSVVVLVWMAGSVCCFWLIARGLMQLRRLLRELQPVSHEVVAELADEAARTLGMRQAPPIFESPIVGGPLSIGLLRPAVVLPSSMVHSFTVDQLQGMLLHELAHIARVDHWVGILQRVTVAIFWWNPLVRNVSSEVSALREQICDDLATSGIKSADGYAEMLVEIAARAAMCRPLPATIGIFERSGKEFTDRVCRLLDGNRPLVTTLNRRMRLASAGILTLMLGITSATAIRVHSADAAPATNFEAGNAQQADARQATSDSSETTTVAEKPPMASEATPLKWPKTVRGIVKDVDGKPIAGAVVRFDLEKIYEYSIGRWDRQIHSDSMTTDAAGEFKFDTTLLPELTHRPFLVMLSCTVDGYADAKWWNWHSREDTTVAEHLANIRMEKGRVVRGRCVDPQGKPVANAIVKVASDHDSKNATSSWAWDPRATNERGEFEISVPFDSKRAVELWAVHRDYAPQHAVVPKSGNELADIRLQHGVRIDGTVKYRDGKPAVGTVVTARSIFDGHLETVTFAAQVAVKTGPNGRYQLPPLEGMYKVFLSQAEETNDRLNDRFVVADEPPPLVVPQQVSLSGSRNESLDFRAGPTLVARGTVRWEDGSPAKGMDLSAVYLPSGFGTGVDLGRTLTDENGNYSFVVPRPLDQLSISASGHFDAKRKWHYAYAEKHPKAENQGLQFMRLVDVDSDLDDLNWVLKAELPK